MNVKTLNIASLDSDMLIIKKSEGSSSGGDTPPSGESTIEYLDVSGVSETMIKIFGNFAPLCKVNNNGEAAVGAPFYGLRLFTGELTTQYTHIQAVGIDLTNRFEIISGGERVNATLVEYLTMIGLATQADLDAIPRITKEEFYTL